MGVTGVASLDSLSLASSFFFSCVRRKTLTVVRRDLWGVQPSAETGVCSHIGHVVGSVDWPSFAHHISTGARNSRIRRNKQDSQMACSQQGRRKALTASLLQMAHRSFSGMSSGLSELRISCQRRMSRHNLKGERCRSYLMSSA